MPDSIAAPDLHTLDRIADLAGIKREYWDIFGTHHPTTEEAKISLLTAMGYDVSSADGSNRIETLLQSALNNVSLVPCSRTTMSDQIPSTAAQKPSAARVGLPS